jgi:hypothetical protein
VSLAWVSASPLARAPGQLVQAVTEALGPVDVLVISLDGGIQPR